MCEFCGTGPDCAVCGRSDFQIEPSGRVWWLSPAGHTCERVFANLPAARAWVDFMLTLGPDARHAA